MSDFNPQGPTQQPGCTGPFSDARDCPVHRPQPIPVEQTSAYQRGLDAGRREILARITALNPPISTLEEDEGIYLRVNDELQYGCMWCGAQWPHPAELVHPLYGHPPNGCLWADAHAKGDGQ